MDDLTAVQARDLATTVQRWRSKAKLLSDRTITGFTFGSTTIGRFKREGWIEVHSVDGITRYRPTEKALARYPEQSR